MENFIGNNIKGLAKNPLGIIALFISLIYGFACLVLSTSISNLSQSNERLPLIWFIIIFPIIILAGFLFLVTKHHQKLYSPSDYGNPESFLKTIDSSKKFEPVQIEVNNGDNITSKKTNELIRKVEDINLNKGRFSDSTKENVKLANEFFNEFVEQFEKEDFKDKISELSFGVQAPEYFLLRYKFKKELLKLENTVGDETVIIRVTRDENDILKLIAIGKDIIEKDPVEFATRIMNNIRRFSDMILKSE